MIKVLKCYQTFIPSKVYVKVSKILRIRFDIINHLPLFWLDRTDSVENSSQDEQNII